jgi:uncharacterized protein
MQKIQRVPYNVADIALKKLGVDCDWLTRTKYNADYLISALNEVLGDKKLGHSTTRLTIPAINVTTGKPKVFKTSHTSELFHDYKLSAVDVLLATSAAPTYFPHAEVEPGSAYVDGGLWANNPAMVALVESMVIREKCNRSGIDPIFNLDTTSMLSMGTGKQAQHAKPPHTKAGIIWWAMNNLLDSMSIPQSIGINFQAQFILKDRLTRINFDIPNPDWSLDNVALVQDMVHIGRQRGIAEVDSLKARFFTQPATKFVPYSEADS